MECNLKRFDHIVFLVYTSKSLRNSTHDKEFCGVTQGLQTTHLALPYYLRSMSWSKQVNMYLQSCDILFVLYLVLLYGGIFFKGKETTPVILTIILYHDSVEYIYHTGTKWLLNRQTQMSLPDDVAHLGKKS